MMLLTKQVCTTIQDYNQQTKDYRYLKI